MHHSYFKWLHATVLTKPIYDSRLAPTVQKGVQQHVEGKDIVDIPEVYMKKLNGLEMVKGKVVHIKDGDPIDVSIDGQK